MVLGGGGGGVGWGVVWRRRLGQEYGPEDGRNNIATLKTLVTEPSDPLDSALGMEHHHLIFSMLVSYGGWIERERNIF